MRKSNYPKNPITFGQKIRKSRMDKGLKLFDVSQRCEITEGYLSRVENDKQLPKMRAMLDIMRWSGLKTNDFDYFIYKYIEKIFRKEGLHIMWAARAIKKFYKEA